MRLEHFLFPLQAVPLVPPSPPVPPGLGGWHTLSQFTGGSQSFVNSASQQCWLTSKQPRSLVCSASVTCLWHHLEVWRDIFKVERLFLPGKRTEGFMCERVVWLSGKSKFDEDTVMWDYKASLPSAIVMWHLQETQKMEEIFKNEWEYCVGKRCWVIAPGAW